ncbi:MAG: efflux transporter outer membrane subunit [Deltaproteobacteria bacterium]|nr:efflux transporter outer membrane subunit [Deltaproteobacteria bacterium]
MTVQSITKFFKACPEPPRLRFAAVVGVLLLFAGCTVGPNYVRPKAAAPIAYKESEGWKVAQPRDHLIRGAWWEIFNDPQLNALEEQVNISNQNLAAAEAQFRQARALVQSARSAFFPQVTAGAAATRTRRSLNTAGGSNISAGPDTDLMLPGNVSWELDVWGRVRRAVESSQASAQASAADLEATRLSLQAELAQDYFSLRALDAQKRLYDETITAYQKFLQMTKNRYEKGVASKADVLQAETQLKSTQAQAIDVGVGRAQMEHAIALLMGKPASDVSIPVAPLATIPPPIPTGVPSELLERRPDIAAAERRAAAANAQIGVAEAAFYPKITLSGSGGFESSNLSNWLSWPSSFWSVGSALAATLFDGGSRQALSDQARAAYDANVAAYRQTVLTGFQEVEDNLAALRILEEEGRVQNEAVKAAEQSVTVSTNQYKAGTISYLEVLVIQQIALTNARAAINILGRRMTAGVLLIKALGGGWQSSDLPSADNMAGNLEQGPKKR